MASIALITGANKGLGFETARQLAAKGYTVVLGSRDPGRGEEAAERLRAEGALADAVKLDVTDEEDIRAVFDFLEVRYGRLDVLVNNAGILHGESLSANSVLDVRPEDVRLTFETNFFGALRLTQVLLPLLRKSDAGRIVNVSSILSSLSLHADPLL